MINANSLRWSEANTFTYGAMQTIADLPLKAHDRQAIDAVVSLLHSQFPVEKVILYGSEVSGQDGDESDIDLLVLTKHPLPWQVQIRSKSATPSPMPSLTLS